jgi:RecJ-like exonuclease
MNRIYQGRVTRVQRLQGSDPATEDGSGKGSERTDGERKELEDGEAVLEQLVASVMNQRLEWIFSFNPAQCSWPRCQ